MIYSIAKAGTIEPDVGNDRGAMRLSLGAAVLAGLALVSAAKPSYASGGCTYVFDYGSGVTLDPDCPSGTGKLAKHFRGQFSCDTGAPPPPACGDGGAFENGIPDPYPGCYVGGTTIIGPVIRDGCGVNDDDPPACTVSDKTHDARKSDVRFVGDPVDLTTAALSLDPVDVDLGHGLRFARHYSSKTTSLSTMGKSWAHSLEWKLFRATAYIYPVIIVKEPLRPAIPFASNGSDYTGTDRNGGSVTVDGSGVVHYRSDTGVEADFDTSNRLIALRYPSEPPISVSYGASSTTFTNGSQTLVVSFYASGTSAGFVSSVAANGEIWTYAYNGNKYLTTVVGPDPSTPSTTDTLTWAYVYTPATSNRITRIDRTSGSGTTTLASWAFNSTGQVTAADEPALEQALQFSYSTPQTGVFRTTVSNASSQTLALFGPR